jgi:hypothetical protein
MKRASRKNYRRSKKQNKRPVNFLQALKHYLDILAG